MDLNYFKENVQIISVQFYDTSISDTPLIESVLKSYDYFCPKMISLTPGDIVVVSVQEELKTARVCKVQSFDKEKLIKGITYKFIIDVVDINAISSLVR